MLPVAAMGLAATLAVLALSLAALGLSVWREQRRREALDAPLVPSWLVQFLALTAALLMLAHLVTLLTGQPFAGRMG